MKLISGIHHVTALASNPQKNVAFYTGLLGLRLIKKTINFDDVSVYHLYYGNEKGDPGTILTFFPYTNIAKGRQGNGQLTTISFSIDEHALDFWLKRFDEFKINYQKPYSRFDELVISFEDEDGQKLELVAGKEDTRMGFSNGKIPLEYAIKGFFGVTLSEQNYEKTANLLVGQLDHQLVAETSNRRRYSAGQHANQFVDIVCKPDLLRGLPGYGTVHHIAFATDTDATQLEVRKKLSDLGLNITPVIDREYFHSIYFREPGGVLFEVATMQPGFLVDESLENLGKSLKLPPWQEVKRDIIERQLPPITL